MFALEGRSDLATGKGGREEARGGRTGGAGAEGRADGPVISLLFDLTSV